VTAALAEREVVVLERLRMDGAARAGQDAAEGDDGEIDDRAIEMKFAEWSGLVKVRFDYAFDRLDLPALRGGDAALENSAGGDGLDQLPGHRRGMHHDHGTMLFFSMPAVTVTGWEDPEAVGTQRELLVMIQKDAATPLDDGVELPVDTRMLEDGHGVEAPGAAAEVLD